MASIWLIDVHTWRAALRASNKVIGWKLLLHSSTIAPSNAEKTPKFCAEMQFPRPQEYFHGVSFLRGASEEEARRVILVVNVSQAGNLYFNPKRRCITLMYYTAYGGPKYRGNISSSEMYAWEERRRKRSVPGVNLLRQFPGEYKYAGNFLKFTGYINYVIKFLRIFHQLPMKKKVADGF